MKSNSTKIGLVYFPGSNNEQDWLAIFKKLYQLDLCRIDFRETTLPKVSGLIFPGGFSYGDYLRAGALAAHSGVMQSAKKFAQDGGPILGVCNGFQILTESGLLAGTLLPNSGGRFICKKVKLQKANGNSVYHSQILQKTLVATIAHGMGRYFIDSQGLKKLQDKQQIVFTYEENPNGALANIAGICSENGRVLGMMPHPERASDLLLAGTTDGKMILDQFVGLCG